MVILQSFSVKALLTFANNSSSSNSSVTITIIIIIIINNNNNNNNNYLIKQLKQVSIPFRKGIYILVLAK
jgi:hypothetical protein